MALSKIIQAFRQWREYGEPLVWVTVIETEGNTYSKAGGQMLIGRDGRYQGLLSGGCLEGDLLERVQAVRDTGEPQRVFYDMRDVEADELWGLGLGCDGAMTVFIQRLNPEDDYQPFTDLADWSWNGIPGACALVVASKFSTVPLGASIWQTADYGGAMAMDEDDQATIVDELGGHCVPGLFSLALGGGTVELFCMPLPGVPRVLVIGAGPDAVPLADLADLQGWRCTVVDYREAAVHHFTGKAENVACLDAGELSTELELDCFDAAVVLTHNQARDRDYLAALAGTAIPYVGLLGPETRRDRLLKELGVAGAALEGRVYGPVGLELGGRGPEVIALSIAAQLQAVFSGILVSPGQVLSV